MKLYCTHKFVLYKYCVGSKHGCNLVPSLLQAIEAGLPLPPDPADMSDVKLKTSQNVLDTLESEEAAAVAKLNMDLEDNLGNEERRQLSEKMRDHMVTKT